VVQVERQGADAEFKPNLVNTVCFIVQNAMQLITFAVNYIGEPFQTPLFENTGMISSLRASTFILVLVASGLVPQATAYVQLVTIPADIRTELFGGVLAVAVLTTVIERSLRDMFPASTPPRKGYMSHLDLLPQKDKLL
jgi:manganese-transporting P-type ATPase